MNFILTITLKIAFVLSVFANQDELNSAFELVLQTQVETSTELKLAEQIVLEYLLRLEVDGFPPNDINALLSHTMIDEKSKVIPDLGAKKITNLLKYGSIGFRMLRLDTGATNIGINSLRQAQNNATMAATGVLNPTFIFESVRTLGVATRDGFRLFEILRDLKAINADSMPGTSISIMDADYQPLVNYIRAVEILNVLHQFRSDVISTSSFRNFYSLILAEVFAEFVNISRQVSGIQMISGGEPLSFQFISIVAYALQDLPIELTNEVITYVEDNYVDFSQGESRNSRAARQHEVSEALDKLKMSLENIDQLKKQPMYSGKLVAVSYIALGLLQSELETVDTVLEYLERSNELMNKLGVNEGANIRLVTNAISKSATALRETGHVSGNALIGLMRIPQYGANLASDGIEYTLSGISKVASSMASAAMVSASTVGSAFQATGDSISGAASSALNTVKGVMNRCEQVVPEQDISDKNN